jgi:hypothetical protein
MKDEKGNTPWGYKPHPFMGRVFHTSYFILHTSVDFARVKGRDRLTCP